MICEEEEILFVEICRNACVSIRSSFGETFKEHDFILGHHSVGDMGEPIPPKVLDTYKSFCVVRNPFDRMVSIWLWGYKGWKAKTFKEFLTRHYNGEYKDNPATRSVTTSLISTWHYSPQIDWIVDKSGKIAVDRIIRFENLKNDFKKLCKDWGLPKMRLKKKNTAKSRCGFERKPWTRYYDGECLEMVRELFEKDFKAFNYKESKR